MSVNADLQEKLDEAHRAAEAAIASVGPHQKTLLAALVDFQTAAAESSIQKPSNPSESAREAIQRFETEYDALLGTLQKLPEQAARDLTRAYADNRKNARFVTIMLFGRTRAGKSTTMEALTGGKGTTIGTGRQHTTRDILAYYLPQTPDGEPPDRPALRVVDTPGIEGFQGEELQAKAEAFVDRCDHILFLLTDDKAGAAELEQFGQIRTQGKSATVLLNVKSADDEIDILESAPQYIFKEEELEGHKRRIGNYLRENLEMETPAVIPFHARAAWLAHSKKPIAGVSSPETLRIASRIHQVEKRLGQFIREEAIPARIRAPRDLLNSHLVSIKDELRPFAGKFRETSRNMYQIGRKLEEGVQMAARRARNRIPLLEERFQAVADAIPGFVDAAIESRYRGHTLGRRWRELRSELGAADAYKWFARTGQKDFESEISESARVALSDLRVSGVEDVDDLLGDYYATDENAKKKKFSRAGTRTAAGTGAALLTGWAIFNFWNPSGWAAAAAAVVTAGAGMAAEKAARSATDDWDRSDRKELIAKRSEIIRKLKARLWEEHRLTREASETWVREMEAACLKIARDTSVPVMDAAKRISGETVQTLHRLDAVFEAMNREMVSELLERLVPEVASGQIAVEKIVREPGFACKIQVVSRNGGTNPVLPCLGPKAKRLRTLRAALGDPHVNLIDGASPIATRVAQALGIREVSAESVRISQQNGKTEARVLTPANRIRSAIGPRGLNAMLTRNLLGIRINIVMEGEE